MEINLPVNQKSHSNFLFLIGKIGLAKLQLISLIFLGLIFLLIWLKLKFGIWWPDFMLLNKFWLSNYWIFILEFITGWLAGWIILKVDQIKSQSWYQSQPLTRSISFCLILLGLGIFVMTSTDIWLGMALILSFWSQLTVEALYLQSNPQLLAEVFLHDIKSGAREKLAEKMAGKIGFVMLLGLVFLVSLGLI
jgi:hypothetical protein